MYLIINILGVVVFLALGVLLSKRRKEIQWRGVGTLLVMNIVLAWFLTTFPIGRDIVARRPRSSASSTSPTKASRSRSPTGYTSSR